MALDTRYFYLYGFFLLVLTGCASGDEFVPDPPKANAPTQEIMEKLRRGIKTTERPEVGEVNGCTTTLVASDVAITAAHCMGYGTRTSRGYYATLSLTKGHEEKQIRVERYRSFGRGLGTHDIALLGLAESVPKSFAQPAPLAARIPSNGTSLTVYGYGCTSIGGGGYGHKRKAHFRQGEPGVFLCPGDSGGPVFEQATGALLRIASGYNEDRARTDIYASVPRLYDQLRTQIRSWSRGSIPQVGRPDDPSEPEDTMDDPPDDDDGQEICGRDLAVYNVWTCTTDRTQRYRCLEGEVPAWTTCDLGCRSMPAGEDDVCGRRDDGESGCGEEYRPYTAWTCASDRRTLFRCRHDKIEQQYCRRGCRTRSGREDRCRWF